MLWRVSLTVAVVCVGGICSSFVRADAMNRLIVPRDYGVKLCGREFIRAVIFTCGGSRWKRSSDLDPYQWNSLDGTTVEDNQQSWQRSAELTDTYSQLPVASSYSLADLLTLHRATSDRQQPPLSVPASVGASTVLGKQENLDGADRLMSSKKKRNFSLGVAGMCCNQGCTKNDIGRLC